jgi:hypothetical protein
MAANTDDIRIGKGIVSFTETEDENNLRDLGFVPTFVITADITTKDYLTAREGIGTVAKTFITQLKSTIKFRIDSIIGENLAYFAMAELEQDTDGNSVLISLSKTDIEGILKCEGTNDNGHFVDWIGKVSLRPSGDLSLITDGDDFTGIEIEATCIRTDAFGFGKYTVHDGGSL